MVVCSNCHIDIDESKLVLHQRFCLQNIKYCEKCQEAVPIEEFEEHLSGHLSRKPSKASQEEINKEKELTLKKIHSSKIGCQYCGLFCNFDEIEDHEAFCGATTSQCPFCKKKMLKREVVDHAKKVHNKEVNLQVEGNNLSKKSSGLSSLPSVQRTDSEVNRQINEDEQLAKALMESMQDQ